MKNVFTHRQQKPQIFTWATFPGPTLAPVGLYFISDVGINGSFWYNNGITLTPTAPITLHNTYYGIIMHSMAAANAATYSQSGTTLTCTCVGHNIPATIHNGKSIHLTPGTPATGAQLATGLYTNFTYVDVNTFTCTSTVSQTGTGALNTNIATTPVPGINVEIFGGLLGINGWLDAYSFQQCNANANSKRLQFKYGSLAFKNMAPVSSTIAIQETHRLQNMESTAKQVAFAVGSVGYSGNSSVAPIFGTIDSSVTQNITASCTLAAALDFMTLDHLVITLGR